MRSWRAVCAIAGVFVLSGVLPGTGLESATAANPVIASIEPSPLVIELRPFAAVPDNSFGTAPRLNSMATVGDRLFVVADRDGLIYELIADPSQPELATTRLHFDVGAAVLSATGRSLDRSSLAHGGLRAIAFHPAFETNGRLYVSMLESRPASSDGHSYLSDVESPVSADSVVVEFSADTTTGDVDPSSYREIFRVGLADFDHPVKQLAFNPFAIAGDEDFGLLYVGHGDGSLFSTEAGDGTRNDALGKVLRIDPLASPTSSYSVPASNPFVDDPTMLDEVFSLGHRNPQQLAFAPLPGGLLGGEAGLIVAEPGRDNVEEINVILAGANYGWSEREGTFVHVSSGVVSGVSPLPSNEAELGFTYPAAQYGHEGAVGSSVTAEAVAGGYAVTNGSALDGHYFYADFPRSGRLFHSKLTELGAAVTQLDSADEARNHPEELTQATVFEVASIHVDHDNDPLTPSVVRNSLLDVFDDAPTYESTRADVRFGQGPGGELYVMSKRNNLVYIVVNSVAPPPGLEPIEPTEPVTPIEPTPAAPCGSLDRATTLAEVQSSCDYDQGDAEVLRLYRAFFDREPELGGAKYWLEQRRSGRTFDEIAEFFSESPEFRRTYGSGVSDQTFLEIIYRNALGRQYDQAGFDYWLGRIEEDGLDRHLVVRFIAGSPEFVARYPYGFSP